MAKHRSHSIEFKRQVAQEFIAGETLHGLAQRHDVARNLIRIWVAKYEAGGPLITDVGPLLGNRAERNAPFRNSSSRAWRPTNRSSAAILASQA